MIEGTSIKIGETIYVIPPMNLRLLKKYGGELAKMSSLKDTDNQTKFDAMAAVVPIVHECVKRNYPDVTLEMMEDMIDLANFRPIIEAIMGLSGISTTVSAEGSGPVRTAAPPAIQ